MNDLKSIRQSIAEFKAASDAVVARLLADAERMMAACEKVGRSWSGSFAGYHGRLYYKKFESPSLGHMFSPEWGGINGIPDGWVERSPEEVKAEIERLAQLAIDEIEALSEELLERATDFRTDLLDQLSTKSALARSERASRLLFDIENWKFGERKRDYIIANLPKGLATRDHEALLQGICTPSHVYYEGIAHEILTTASAVREFTKALDRLARYIEDAESAEAAPDVPNAMIWDTIHLDIATKCRELFDAGAYAEAVEKSFKVVRDRLRTLSGYETGAKAFGEGKLHIKGAAAANVDEDFNEAVKFLLMAIDRFRNEKSHTSDAKIDDPVRAYEYLRLSSLALNLLRSAEVRP